MTITDAWNAAAAAAPPGWRIEGLRCTSRGLEAALRGDRWIAEACGPEEACIVIEDDDPHRALQVLAGRLRDERSRSPGSAPS